MSFDRATVRYPTLQLNHVLPTLAISPQLFCASLIVLRRCSSAGVHGVLVLLFLGAGIGEAVSGRGSIDSPKPDGSPSPVECICCIPAMVDMPGALRFRDGGEVISGWGGNKSSSGWGL